MTDKITENKTFLPSLVASVRIAAATVFICCICYTLIVLGVAQTFNSHTANGSLILSDNGTVIGSELIAQKFTNPKYFYPRPSAVDYNGFGAGGSNLSPASPKIKERAESISKEYNATPDMPLPLSSVAASGSGLDPHISLFAALYQVPRVAQARNIDEEMLAKVVRENAETQDFMTGEQMVNVLKLNLALDNTSINSK